MGKQPAAKVHPDVRLARFVELFDHLWLSSAMGDLVVGVEQPVGVAHVLQAGAVVVLQSVADVEVQQLGGEQRAAVDALHGVLNGDRMRRVGNQFVKTDSDGAQRHADTGRVMVVKRSSVGVLACARFSAARRWVYDSF